MRKINFLFVFLLSVMGVTQAWAQKALPYSYGFEDNNLATDGWATVNPSGLNNSEFAINTDAKKSGSYGFCFSSFTDSGESTQYLISPELNAPNGVIVSFAYKASSSNTGGEKFKVGYSTTDAEISSFTWGDEISYSSTTWAGCENTFPAGTKYVAVYYYANYQYRLYVDDFQFDPVIVGPGFAVEGYVNGGNVDFGLAEAGATKTFKLLNPGTESVTVGIAATGGYSVSASSVTIAAKGSETITVTAPNASGNGILTFTPTASGVDALSLNLSYTAPDADKYFFGFEGGSWPEGWTDHTNWSIVERDGNYFAENPSDWNNMVFAPLHVTKGDKLYIKAKKLASTARLRMYYNNGEWSSAYDLISQITSSTEYSIAEFTVPDEAFGSADELDELLLALYGGELSIDYIYGLSKPSSEPSAVITNVMLPGEFNGWQGAQNELTYDATEKAYKGVLDLSNTTADQQFKLLVRAEGYANDIYLGWQQKDNGLTINAPEGWVVDYSNDNLYLLNSATNYKTYDVTAKWQASADATTGWTLTIAGKDERYNTYTATFADNAGWGNVYAYTWTGEGAEKVEQLGAWPGKKLELNADGKYEVTVLGDEAPSYIIFHNNNGTQTENLEFINGNEYNNAVLTQFTATYVNAAGWTDVYAYVWSGDGNTASNKALGEWPGTKLTAGADGKYAVEFEAIEAPEKIIFNNGDNNKEQTADLVFVDANEYNLFYEGFVGTSLQAITSSDLPGWEKDTETHDGAGDYAGNIFFFDNNGTSEVFYYVTNYQDTPAYLITPKLHVSNNDAMAIRARRGTNDGTAKIVVSYSADKTTWTEATTLSYSSSSYATTPSIVNQIPEGNWYVKYELSDAVIDYVLGFTRAEENNLELTEAATENQVVAGTYDEVTVAFTMQAGKFAAICLPFATTTTALGEGVKAWAFTGYTDGNIDLSTTTDLAAATPYIVYAENGINGLTFQNVTIESNEAGKVEQGAATFQGSYVKMPAGTLTGKYGVTPAGKIQKAGPGASMKAFRAYFDGITQGAKLVFDGEIIGEATGIDTIENAAQTGELYDLQGRRVMNAQKGLYIQNGKKFVVK